jgi:hypothetical protein
MKTETNTTTATKAQAAKGASSAKRKAAPARKRTSRAAAKAANDTRSTMAGFSDQAQRLMKRGKTAFSDVSTWASETAHSLPQSARKLGVPDQKSVQSFMSEQPLIVGAVGLGLGVVLGAMMPSRTVATKPVSARKPSRRK